MGATGLTKFTITRLDYTPSRLPMASTWCVCVCVCACVCTCACVCKQLPVNQSFDKLISSHQKGGGVSRWDEWVGKATTYKFDTCTLIGVHSTMHLVDPIKVLVSYTCVYMCVCVCACVCVRVCMWWVLYFFLFRCPSGRLTTILFRALTPTH